MSHHHSHNSTKNIKIAFFLNLGFTVFEIIGGIWTNSVAILSDAVHDLGDSLSLGLAWFLDKKSKQEKDKKYSFGYQRFSLLGALINGVVLISGSLYMLSTSIPRIISPEHTNAEGMFLFSIFGIAVNGVAVLRMKNGKTMNEKIVSWHLLEDVLGWVAVLIVSVVLMFWDIPILDPILSILIIIYVLYNAYKHLRKTFVIFLQGVPSEIDMIKVNDSILNVEGVKSVHHTNVWSLDGEKHVLTIHVVIEKVDSIAEIIVIKQNIKRVLQHIPIKHATIEIEFEDETCYMED